MDGRQRIVVQFNAAQDGHGTAVALAELLGFRYKGGFVFGRHSVVTGKLHSGVAYQPQRLQTLKGGLRSHFLRAVASVVTVSMNMEIAQDHVITSDYQYTLPPKRRQGKNGLQAG